MAEGPTLLGVVPPPDSADAEGETLAEPPGYAEKLREAVADRPRPTGGGAGPKPSEREWVSFLGERVLRWLMIFYVSWLTAPLEWDTDRQRQLIAPQEERRAMVQPLARVIATSELNERIGRKVLDLDDGLEALIMFGLWLDTTRPVLRQRQQVKAAERAQRQQQQPEPHYQPTGEEAPHEFGGPSQSGAGPGATVSGYPFGVIPGGSGA